MTGVLLAIANVAVIGTGIAIAERSAKALPLVAIYGGVPALLLGLLLGVFANATRTWSRHVRIAMIAIPAAGLVQLLATEFAMTAYVGGALVPTFVAAALLERFTAQRGTPPVPLARAR